MPTSSFTVLAIVIDSARTPDSSKQSHHLGSPGDGGASTGSGGLGPGTGGAAGVTFCTDFEDSTVPGELLFWPEYLRDEAGTYFSLDTTAAVSGSQSLKVIGSDFSQMYSVPIPASTFWGRVQLMSDSDIQSSHSTYVAAATGTGDPNEGEAIRIGEHQCQLELNPRTSSSASKSTTMTQKTFGTTTWPWVRSASLAIDRGEAPWSGHAF